MNKTIYLFKLILNNQKNGRFKDWFYKWKNGHPFLLSEEVDIICEIRFNEKYKWINDEQIQKLVRMKVKEMYKKRYPDAKRWSLAQVGNLFHEHLQQIKITWYS